jgi:cytochrome c-type biogenesis protein CcmH
VVAHAFNREPRMTTMHSPRIDELKRQLAQLDALLAQGVLTGEAAHAMRERIERDIVDAVTGENSVPGGQEPGRDVAIGARPSPSRALLAGVASCVLLVAVLGYVWRGNPASLVSATARAASAAVPEAVTEHATDDAQIEAMLARLAERLKSHPDDAEGWAMLARSYSSRGRFDAALPGYRRVVELRPLDAQALADYADGLASASGHHLDGEPEKLVTRALQLDANNVKALSLAGTIAFDRDDFAGAVHQWERAVSVSDPTSEFTGQLRGALAEARQRAGLSEIGTSGGATQAPAPTVAADSAGVAAEAITGRVSLGAAVASKVSPTDTVFIYARAPSGSKMPLAILRKKASELPLDFTLDDRLAMSPSARLSSASQVIVSARVSKSGDATPQPGDLQGTSALVPVGTRNLSVEIGDAK